MILLWLLTGIALGAAVAALLARGRGALARERIATLRSELERERADGAEKVALLDGARSEFETAMKALAADALRSNNESFLALARTQLEQKEKAVEGLVGPIRESLEKVDGQLRGLETARVQAYSTLTEQVGTLVQTQDRLRAETGNLVTALRAPATRGRWGETQLKRVVEMAGMLEHCDFDEQVTVAADGRRLRPDLVVKLPGGKRVVVDSKVPLEAYLSALEAPDDATRTARLQDHARQIRQHIAKLSAKAYWEQFRPTPEFVVLFLASDAFHSAALEQDASLLEEGVHSRVLIATPTTLIALLQTVAYAWNEETVAESARAVNELGRELYSRLGVLARHFATLGSRLESTVGAYNQTVGSFERRVLPAARRFPEHGAGTGELAEPIRIERTPARVEAAELPAPAGGTSAADAA